MTNVSAGAIEGPDEAERAHVIDVLRHAGGVLGLAEAERRMDAAVAARSRAELALLVYDLPAQHLVAHDPLNGPPAPAPPIGQPAVVRRWGKIPGALASPGYRMHAWAYGLTNTMLTGVWAIADPHDLFWPFFPIAGWGIGLGMHAAAVRTRQRVQAGRQRHDRSYDRSYDERQQLGGSTRPALDRPGGSSGGSSGRSSGRSPHGSGRAPGGRPSRAPGGGSRGRSPQGSTRWDDPGSPALGAPVGASPTPAPVVDTPAGARSGAPVSGHAVVMFTDVVDSTRLTAVIGDEAWGRVRGRLRGTLLRCYAAFDGRELNSAGDGSLARFDRPSDAARCAIEVQRCLAAEREELGFAPSVRVGIHRGDVVEQEGDVHGSTVNLAARVCAAAAPDEVLVTEAVADGLDGAVAVSDAGLRELKGVGRQAHVLRVDWR